MTQNYENTYVYPRVWGNLIDVSTGRTLGLVAGESTAEGVLMWEQPTTEDDEGNTVPDWSKSAVQVPLPDDFEDEYLKPVAAPAPAPAASKSTKGATADPAEATATADPKE